MTKREKLFLPPCFSEIRRFFGRSLRTSGNRRGVLRTADRQKVQTPSPSFFHFSLFSRRREFQNNPPGKEEVNLVGKKKK